ncbi:RINT-1 family protein [Cordyceps fumosorosea ARSEF 2679]|uniref:RINT-1 family protein n=1 Tax=Cordyceps fumosorosea (strain ARSEF 2679) TaxID=1081104 RepID=A0A168EB04_CORFA|nr:RINT-1 family protein [Cordyceps fumosorosea ARSEF 2679]OAA73595.1 RINT-1 family protein [Cordyceps fumosorosea ARSEF 2679]
MPTTNREPPESALDARVEDYLEDKLQSADDLDTLDTLLDTVDLQLTQLQTQLDAAVQELDTAQRTTDDRYSLLQQRIAEFRTLQDSIDERVRATVASDAPAEAIARLQRPMQKLKAVDLARRYLVLLQDVERLRADAKVHLPGSPKAALKPYAQLKELALTLRGRPGAEELHLVDHVEAVTGSLWAEMKKIMSDELEAVLEKRGWPRVDPNSEMDEEWIECFEKLVDIQMPELLHSPTVVPLLPVDVMARIFVAEFRFHFLSDKPTSKAQSMGTHCFPWFLSIIEKWEDFFCDNLAPVLSLKFQDTPVAGKSVYADPVCALITSMLMVMREKVHAVAKEAASNMPFLSTFIGQLVAFDETIRAQFRYDGGDAQKDWPGLTSEILADYFEVWFEAERKFSLERFDAILEAADARKIDYDHAVVGKMKPTFAAVRVTDLLRTITTKYDGLCSLKYKVRFLTRIQLDILDGYHERLKGSLEAYQSMTSALGRTLHGATKEQLAALEGLGALETLCKIIGSADHIANVLVEWGEEEFFTELWDGVQAAAGSGNSSELDGEQDLTRSPRRDGGIFAETVDAYNSRRKAAEDVLVSTLADAHAKAFRAYTQRPQWTTIGDADTLDPLQFSITAELDLPLSKLEENFKFLHGALSSASYDRVWHRALSKLQDLLWNGVLMKHQFTILGAIQFAHDSHALAAVVERHLPGGSARLEELSEAVELLRLPAAPPGEVTEARSITLEQASERAFTDNNAARALLEEMQLLILTPTDARRVLQRRVENDENMGW